MGWLINHLKSDTQGTCQLTYLSPSCRESTPLKIKIPKRYKPNKQLSQMLLTQGDEVLIFQST
jgi:hypothetical protein